MRPKFHSLTVCDIRRETKDCISIAFEVPLELKENYRFKQGQYVTLRQDIGGVDTRRSYSICSGVNDGELRIAIKSVDQGVFSNYALHEIKIGQEIQVMTPMGHFTCELDATQKKNYLLVAAGSGITPVLSIAKSVLQVEPFSEVTLLYGNRHFMSIIFREELEEMKDRYLGRFRLFHILTAEPNEVELLHGRIDQNKLQGFAHTFLQIDQLDEVFVCGPEPIIRAVSSFMEEKGMAKEKVHFELFATPGQVPLQEEKQVVKKAIDSSKKCAVTVMFDGQESNFYMPIDGTAILDAAQQHGLDIPYSCKGGMCMTCRAHITEGDVEMKVNYSLEPGEVEMGYVLTCQGVPTSENIVVDYDRH